MIIDILWGSTIYSNYAAKIRKRFNLFHLPIIYCHY